MTRSPAEAIKWARDHMSWPPGYCLQWVRTCYGVSAKYYDAEQAWVEARYKHRTESGQHCPRGAPVYWTGGSSGHGHIALSVGNGYCLSTDAGGSGRVAKVRIDNLTAWWGHNFQGWAEDVNGVKVFDVRPPDRPADGWDRVSLGALDRREANKDIERVKWALRKKVGMGDMDLDAYAAYWGRAATRQYKQWQERIGLSGNDADGRPGEYSLRKLGRSAGFEVIA